MARSVFLSLVLLNLIVLAWVAVRGDDRINAGREPQRIKTALAADKVRIMALTDAASSPQSAVPAVSATAVDVRCSAYSGATVVEAQDIVKTWSTKLPAAQIASQPVLPKPVFDIVIAGLISTAAVETKQMVLKKLGASDGIRVRAEEDKRYSVFIASFADRNAANEALKGIVQKGVTTAAIVERQPAAEKATIEVHGGEAVMKQLPELAASHKGLSPVACDAAKTAP